MITFELKYLVNPLSRVFENSSQSTVIVDYGITRLFLFMKLPYSRQANITLAIFFFFLINNIETLNVFNKGHWKSDHNQNQFLFPFTVTVCVILSLTVLDVKYDQDSCVTFIICYLLPTACGDSGP